MACHLLVCQCAEPAPRRAGDVARSNKTNLTLKRMPPLTVQKKRRLGRGVALVGAGMSKFGRFIDSDSQDLFAEAFRQMMLSVDKGLNPEDIDALYLGNFSNDFLDRKSVV